MTLEGVSDSSFMVALGLLMVGAIVWVASSRRGDTVRRRSGRAANGAAESGGQAGPDAVPDDEARPGGAVRLARRLLAAGVVLLLVAVATALGA